MSSPAGESGPADASAFDRARLAPGTLDDLAERVRTLEDRQGLAVRTPITTDPIGTVPTCTAEDVAEAAERARASQSIWEATPVAERAAVLERLADLVDDRREWLLDLVQLETGKARIDALEELVDVTQTASYYAQDGPTALDDEERSGAIPLLTDATVTRDPVGVVGVISPWNYPLTLSMTDAIPALLAGNAVVCKPDERTPYVALALAACFEEAGLPEGVFQVVTGDGATVGPALIDAVDYVAFTGGTETGRSVAARAGRNLIDCSLELGGKNPLLVLADADVETAARGAVAGAFANAGQLCLAPERIYVHEDRYDAFLDAFVDQTRDLTLGHAFSYGPDVGSLIDEDHLERVDEFVSTAVEDGASLHTGGRARPDVGPCWYEPTILTDVPRDAAVACDETFGPVVSVFPVADAEAAVERANDTDYGLNASVWTGDRERGRRVAREIECGTVCVNDPYTVGWAALDAPMGGLGDSGVGRRHGPEGIQRFTESKTIATSRIGSIGSIPGLSNRWTARVLTWTAALHRRLERAMP